MIILTSYIRYIFSCFQLISSQWHLLPIGWRTCKLYRNFNKKILLKIHHPLLVETKSNQFLLWVNFISPVNSKDRNKKSAKFIKPTRPRKIGSFRYTLWGVSKYAINSRDTFSGINRHPYHYTVPLKGFLNSLCSVQSSTGV